jgi:hypothetical protein
MFVYTASVILGDNLKHVVLLGKSVRMKISSASHWLFCRLHHSVAHSETHCIMLNASGVTLLRDVCASQQRNIL